VNPDQEYNAAIYRDMAFAAAMDILHRGKRVFLVGGTGLYIKSLLGGLLQCPPSSPELKKALQEEWKSDGGRAMYKRLMRLDPQRAEKIHPHDHVRVIRALEIMLLTNSAPSNLTKLHAFSERNFTALKFCLIRERPELYDRIDKRTLGMIEEGLFSETEKLLGKGYSPRLKSLQAIGYKQSVAYLEGHLTREKAITEIQKETRRYAKRQITWFRADSSYTWVDPRQEKTLAEKIESFFDSTAEPNLVKRLRGW
jgi:tRNA dimethylallyltransferase